MAWKTNVIDVGIQSSTDYASHVMLLFGKTPCSNEDNSNELNTRTPSPAPTEPVTDVDIVPATRHSTYVSNPHTHLNDYHYYSAIKTLHVPSSYPEVSTNPI